MRISCFHSASKGDTVADSPDAPRPISRTNTSDGRAKFRSKSFPIRRHGSGNSSTRQSSNSSISNLPPCPGICDPKVEAMMMPEPLDAPPSKCLRLSQPKTYGNIVDSMKQCKGCRDWRNFAVFYDNDIDMNKSADLIARKRALDYARKCRQFDSFNSENSEESVQVDMIG